MSIFKLGRSLPQTGQATVEFALAAFVFFTAFLAIVEFAHLFYVKLSLQHALREAGRYMITGRADVPDPNDPTGNTMLPRCDPGGNGAVNAIFEQNIKGIGGTPTLTITNLSSPGGALCGESKEAIKLEASFTKPWFSVLADKFLPGGVPLGVSMTWINEPFP